MRKHRRPATVLAAVMMVSLLALSSVYALWYEKLTFNATVTTGELNVRWRTFSCAENEAPTQFNNPLFPIWPKQVGSFTTVPAPGDANEQISLTITNGYPGYAVDCKIEWQNIGTIPVHLEVVNIMVDLNGDGDYLDAGENINCTTNDCSNINPYTPYPAGHPLENTNWSFLTPSAPLLVHYVDNGLGCQVHPPGSNTGDLLIGVRQPAVELTTYSIKITLQFNQYNESGYSGCGTPKPNTQPFPAPDSPRENPIAP